MNALNRFQIVGMEIRAVLVSPWDSSRSVALQRGFVQLVDGAVFELLSVDPEEVEPLVDCRDTVGEVREWEQSKLVQGDIIQEIVSSWNWPSLGVLLASGRVLNLYDCPHPLSVMPMLSEIGDWFALAEMTTYWGKNPLG